MSLPLVTRQATPEEVEQLRLLMSVFRDGSGDEREKDGTTRAGWRVYERIIAELLAGDAPEGKAVFDVTVASTARERVDYGISVKSKQLSKPNFDGLDNGRRVYMELSNSPAMFWAALAPHGLDEAAFRDGARASEMGPIVLDTVRDWHHEYAKNHSADTGRVLDLGSSRHVVISYSALGRQEDSARRGYRVHSFDLEFPDGIQWEYSSGKCLRGYDPAVPGEALVDWYGLSGGQLKYYPRGCDALFATSTFTLLTPPQGTIATRAASYWPSQWADATGDGYSPSSG